MIAFPSGTKVWIAGGVTDMRCGMNGLALKVQAGLGRDPQGGEIFCFRGRKADMVKLIWFDGVGMSLYAKRLEAGKFVWPSSSSWLIFLTELTGATLAGPRGRKRWADLG